MKKTRRILSVFVIAFFALALAAFGFSAKVNAAEIDFEQGAYVRVDTSENGYSGLRFVATISEDGLRGKLFNDDGTYKDNCQVSMLIAPEKAFDAFSSRTSSEGSNYLEFFKARYGFERTQISADIPAEKIVDYTVKGVLNVKEANYGVKYQAVVYYTTDGGTTYNFSDKSVARSVSCVAAAAENNSTIGEAYADGVASFVNGDEGETSHQFADGVCSVCGTTLAVVGEGRGAAVDLGVTDDDLKNEIADQTANVTDPVTIDLGKDYGALRSARFDGEKNAEITLSGSTLTLPASLFSAQAAGEHEVSLRTSSGVVTFPLYAATKVIKTTAEFQSTFRDQQNKPAVYGYFVLGNDLDYEGNALPNHSGGLSYGMLWSCNGFKGTFDGRGYSIKNLNTANPFGLFVRIAPANGSVIKNLVFDDLVHEGGYGANIFAWSTGYVKFDNITINVKKSVVADGVTMDTTPNADTTGVGFLFNVYADKNTYNNITVNADGQEIYSLLGYKVKTDNGSYKCNNFVVNAKKVYYIGKLDGGDAISADTEIAGLTINSKQEITEDLYETGTTSYLVDLGVEDVNPYPNNQTVGSGNAEISIGSTYGNFVSLTYNGVAVEGATYADGVLTFPVNTFAATDRGTEKTVVLTTVTDKAIYTLNVHLFVATRVIKTTAEFEETFRVIAASKYVRGYFVLGADLDYEGKALPAPSGTLSEINDMFGLMGTVDGRGHSIKNFNTGNAYGLFPKIKWNTTSYIKNLVFEDLVHTGAKNATIFGSMMQGIVLENIVINVAQSTIPDGTTMNWGQGLFASSYMTNTTVRNVTVNAKGQEIFSLFAPQVGTALSCENVVVYAKNVQYIGSTDGTAANVITEYSGVTINLDVPKQEIAEDLYETGTTSYLVDLGVENIDSDISAQTVGSGNAEISIGSTYGDFVSLTYNGAAVEGATYADGVLTFPVSIFAATDRGAEKTVVLTTTTEAADYTLTVHLLAVTKVIKTTAEFQNTFRDQKNKPMVYGYFALGNDLDYEGNALPNHSGGLSYGMLWSCNGFKGTFDGRGHSIKNLNTANPFGLFVRIAPANGSVIKNLVFDDLVHDGGYGANIFGWATGYVTFDNITINVKTSVIADGVTFAGTPNAGTTGAGFFFNLYADKNTYNNVTVNADGQEIYSLLGSNVKTDNGNYKCNNFVVNAKKVSYIGKLDGGDAISADTEIEGLTINLPASQLFEDGATTYSVIVPQRNLDGSTDILPAYGEAIVASNELQSFVEKACGQKFNWLHEGVIPSDFNGKFISIGGTSRLSAALGNIPELNANEYFIKTIDGNVYIAGGDTAGLMYGVYDFLKTHFNFEYFADGVYYIDTNVSNCTLQNYKGKVVSPSFTYRLPSYGFESKTSSELDTNYAYRMKFNTMGNQLFGMDGVGGSWHNFFATIPYSTYGSSHSNWFYRYRVSYNSYEDRQLCLSQDIDGLAAEVASKVKSVLTSNASAKYIIIGQEDNDYWCDCSTCTSYIKNNGGFNSATYIRFMNKVSDLIADYLTENDREAYLVMFAYHATQDAPVTGSSGNYSLTSSDMQLRDNVCVMYAPIEANYYVSFNDAVNADVKKNIEGWSLVSKNVFYWFYMENFEYYLDFFDNFGSLRENLQFAAEHNGLYVFNHAQINQSESTSFSHFKSYLNAKLMYNVNEDVAKLTDDFFANYYGAAGDIMKNIYTEIRDMFATKYASDGTIGYLSTKAHKCSSADYDFDKLVEWLGDIDSAYAAIASLESTDATEYARIAKAIKVESMAIRYWILYYYPEEYRTYYNANHTDVISIVAMRQTWKDDAEELGITLWGEHKDISNLYSESWTGLS